MRAASQAQCEVIQQLRAGHIEQMLTKLRDETWSKVQLGDIATKVQNGVYKPNEFYSRGFGLLRMYNLRNDEPSLDLTELARVTLDEGEYDRFRLQTGDLLVSRVNSYERVGKCALVRSDAEECVFENMLFRVQLSDTVEPAFVAEQIMTSSVQDWVRGVARRAIGQSSINSRDVRAIPLLMPPLPEQKAFVARLSEYADSVRRARVASGQQSDALAALPSAILRLALAGDHPSGEEAPCPLN
jgi:type I restriction enzyme S subunit